MKPHPNLPATYAESPIVVSYEEHPNILVCKNGKRYVDFLGHGGCSFLHAYGLNSRVGREEKDVLMRVLNDVVCVTNFLEHEARHRWADTICKLTGYDRVFPLCSGSEANDAAIKLAQRRMFLDTGYDNGVVIAMPGYYGRTIGANTASIGSSPRYADGVSKATGVIPTSSRQEFFDAIENESHVAGVILETLPGRDLHNGFVSDEDVRAIFELKRQKGFAVIVDEVKTGGGRMGSFLDSARWPSYPDIVTMSKTLAAGLPLAAVLATEKMWNGIDSTWHTSTMGGNPAICSYSSYLLHKVTPSMLERVNELGYTLRHGLESMGFTVVGRGLHLNVLMDSGAFAMRAKLMEMGYLVYCIRDDFIALYPNMYTEMYQVYEFLEAIESASS